MTLISTLEAVHANIKMLESLNLAGDPPVCIYTMDGLRISHLMELSKLLQKEIKERRKCQF